ncbi:MAG TPA: translation initiation factor IF-3 [Bdellovibrionota bacterium]|nr:translation initiation factor IF-3 [Bdellovibrionota bacterium]
MNQQPKVNRQIRAKEVRVIDERGGQIGVMGLNDALEASEERGLDLIEVVPNAKPPVCKIMDFGKYKYQEARKLAQARKKQTVIEIKEVKLRPKTERHDIEFKTRHIRRFLEDGDKARVMVVFLGREIEHPEMGQEMLKKIAAEVADLGQLESPPRFDGRTLVMIINPLPEVLKRRREAKVRAAAAQEAKEKEEKEKKHA